MEIRMGSARIFALHRAYSLMGLRLCSRQLLPEYEITRGATDVNSVGELGNSNSAWQVSAVGGRLIRERRRVAKILLVLALVFAFCWLPYSVLSLILDMNAKQAGPPPSPDDEPPADFSTSGNDEDEQFTYIANLLLPFAILLGHSQAAVNPLVFCLLSKNFRRSVTDLIRHPTRAIRSRQQCKIRMTFRKDPVPSAEPNSSEKPVSSRPRNHHAPDPPKSSLVDGGDIRLAEMGAKQSHHLEVVVAYSPTPSSLSSGYSSLRVSDNSLSCHQCSQYQASLQQQVQQHNPCGNTHCGYCSMSLCPYPHYPPISCHCQVHTSSICKKGASSFCEHRRVEVPSTIREESENSHLSQRSKTSSKVCFT
ncbi:Type-2 angiotensin II receptor [Folsomia candida]|uniref:Type-2 angiotensin II receptor n=1 Tax=Folsomia candida TaxID=158441 RepID=A0A226EW11_FOLCA|nr:Type-2 angiotensin II receptor [Folsomia candida]